MIEFNSEYGKYYLDGSLYPIDAKSKKTLHKKVWLTKTNKIRKDLGLKPLTKVPQGYQIHHKNRCRTDYDYSNLQCVRWDKHSKHHMKRKS